MLCFAMAGVCALLFCLPQIMSQCRHDHSGTKQGNKASLLFMSSLIIPALVSSFSVISHEVLVLQMQRGGG